MEKGYISNIKHIKLLLKPLKIRLSKSEQVLIKRYQVWVYLLKHLGDNCAECLEEFLNCCFIPLKNTDTSNENIFGNSVCLFPKEVLCKTTEMFICMLEHDTNCLNMPNRCLSEENYHFTKPVITKQVFEQHHILIIDSVVECSKFLIEWAELDQMNKVINL